MKYMRDKMAQVLNLSLLKFKHVDIGQQQKPSSVQYTFSWVKDKWGKIFDLMLTYYIGQVVT
jgi:hypothetical protein